MYSPPVILQKYGWYTLQLEINKQHVVAHLLLAAFFQLFTGATVAWVVCLQFLANSLLTHWSTLDNWFKDALFDKNSKRVILQLHADGIPPAVGMQELTILECVEACITQVMILTVGAAPPISNHWNNSASIARYSSVCAVIFWILLNILACFLISLHLCNCCHGFGLCDFFHDFCAALIDGLLFFGRHDWLVRRFYPKLYSCGTW